MAVNNIQGTNSVAYQERINQNSETQKPQLNNQHVHLQEAWGKASITIDPQNIIDIFRKNRRLADRLITIDSKHSSYTIPPEALDDVHKKLLGLAHGGHLKTMSQTLLKRLKRNQRFNIIDDNYGDINSNKDDNLEGIKIKRKEGTSIDEGQVNDVIEHMLKENNNPTQRFLLISMTLQQSELDPQLKSILEEILNKDINIHGKEINAKVNSSNEAFIFGQGSSQKTTQFSNIYYELIGSNSHIQMLQNIISAVKNIQEFSVMTNLMSNAAKNDLDKKYIPTSDPNTIHDVISFMNERSKIISLYEGVSKFLKACKLPVNLNNSQAKLGGHLTPQPHPKNII